MTDQRHEAAIAAIRQELAALFPDRIFIFTDELAGLYCERVQTQRKRRLLGTGVPYSRIGRRAAYSLSDVAEFLAARRYRSTTEESDSLHGGRP